MKKVNSNTVIALSALVVSVCALVVSIQEMRVMREQQQSMVYPHVVVGEHYDGEGFGFKAKNSGTGLAIVENMVIAADGKIYPDWLDLVNAVMPEGHGIDYGIVRSTDVVDQVITPGQEVNLFGVRWTDETRELLERIGEVEITMCYRSLLDQQWTVNSKSMIPIESKKCIRKK